MSILITDKAITKSTNKKHVRFNLDANETSDKSIRVDSEHIDHSKLTPLQIAHQRSVLGTKHMFLYNEGMPLQMDMDIISDTIKLKINDHFSDVEHHPLSSQSNTKQDKPKHTPEDSDSNALAEPPHKKQKTSHATHNLDQITQNNVNSSATATMIESVVDNICSQPSTALIRYQDTSSQIMKRTKKKKLKPEWHRPWKLYKVISGHLGWVQSVAMDPSNEYFVTGSADRTIKIWDLASGTLKLTLTGHISAVRGLAISRASPYMFSASEDKKVCCWDLVQNKIIRHYHGHLSGVYALSLHPTLNILFTGGRDSTCRVWDIRTKTQIMVLSGHKHTVMTVASQQFEPQCVTGSMDKTIRAWDLRTGKTKTILTHHKKSIRSVVMHPTEYTFASGGADNIKIWKCPNSDFLRNCKEKPKNIIETLAVNSDNLLVSGHQSGHLKFWNYKTGHKVQEFKEKPQPGSLDSEAGILASTFDVTGTRLITTEADKTIKMWKPDKNAVPPS
eukprot:511567_1